MAKLKILHYIPVYAPAWQFGGPVLSVSQLCEGLAKLGHKVEVLTSNAGLTDIPDLPLGQPIIRNGVTVTYFPQQNGMGINCSGMEQAITDRVKEFDLIHVTGVWQRTSSAACRAAKQANVPYFISPRGALGPYSWNQKTLKKLIYFFWQENFNIRNATGIHYTARQELEECSWLCLPGQPFIIPNGLDTSFWQPNPDEAAAWRASHGLKPDDFLILNVGRLHHKKGLDLLPEALAPLRGLNWQMFFVGGDDDGTKAKLQKQFQAANLQAQVRFLERCVPQQLPVIYTAADLFVLPSRHENFGNVVIEALACGCPVLISDKVGLHNEIQQAPIGWVVPPHALKWEQAIRQIMQDSNQLKSIKLEARSWVKAKFDIDQTARQMTENYIQILSKYHDQ